MAATPAPQTPLRVVMAQMRLLANVVRGILARVPLAATNAQQDLLQMDLVQM